MKLRNFAVPTKEKAFLATIKPSFPLCFPVVPDFLSAVDVSGLRGPRGCSCNSATAACGLGHIFEPQTPEKDLDVYQLTLTYLNWSIGWSDQF